MALVKPVVFQIAGFQDSGKTTLTLKLIEKLTHSGLKVSTIKHHGHGGKPDVPEGKDSGLHILAGASASLVEGGGRLLVQAEKEKWTLSEEIELLAFFKPDAILIEGHKKEKYPKVLILREENDLPLLDQLENIIVILYRSPKLADHLKESAIPVFSASGEEAPIWIANYIKKMQKA